ncbi:MAG: SMC family ATPase [Meiothermus sp.]|uniref:AAA family ATPase n=1 Tax=Meiothermus sp. TaxID=1955249 RepID=UPI0025D35A6D|nr:SMC family ATPase [Meiothermus sp.]MCS7067111.1 SMC family ATPase [Meiothermus sp.]
MRPLKLRLEGFGAYAEPQEISFDDVELFAITGQTGSGKSTLLDAMTYALYKATPRIGSTGLGDLKHPQADSARVELTFRVGEQTWRVVRVVGKENQNRLEACTQSGWKTHPASEKVRELDAKLAEILGMDYETFTRAILLPQGQFDLFLRGSPRERRETLIKLYGLESLKAMRERVAARLKTLGEERARLQGELDALAEAEEERVSAIRQEIEGLERSERDLGSQLQSAEQTLRTLEERQKLFAELEALRRRHTTWQSDQARMTEIANKLLRAEKAERIWPQLEALQAAQNQLRQKENALRRDQSALEALEAELQRFRAEHRPEELATLEQKQHQIPLLKAKEASLKRYGGSLRLYHERPLPFEEERLEALRDAERLFGELEKARTKAARARERLQNGIQELQKEQASIEALQAEIQTLKETGQKDKARLEEAKQTLEREKLHQGVAQYHAHLQVGEPCPLCGHPVKTLPPPKAQANLQALQAQVERLEATLTELRAEFKAKQRRLEDLQQRLPRLQEQLQSLQNESQEADTELADLQAQAAGLGTLEQVKEERTQRLAKLAEEIRAITDNREVAVYVEALRQALESARGLAQKVAEMESQQSDLKGKVSSQAEIVQVLQANLNGQERSVQALLEEAGFAGPEAVQKARLSPPEMEALRKKLKDHEHEGVEIDRALRALEQALSGQAPVTPAQVSEHKNHVAGLKASLAETRERLGGKKSDLERLQDQLARKRQAQKAKAELDKQTDLWEQLAQDLKGDRFQDFLLERYQSGLLRRASELIQSLSQNRYSLRLEEGEYRVLDRWTEALRPVRTLSGGESFMASLSLALSLSEHLSRGRIGALFLDEGFGTLDAETLEQVAGVLEALPTQGRLVGVVTHVEALAERLPARLLVEKSPAGSRVRWKD